VTKQLGRPRPGYGKNENKLARKILLKTKQDRERVYSLKQKI
jgi:hypothetical protein